ncbi:MAG: prolyl oligopeptidase family serine peptidase, partial [Bacteroidales bacterium]|nr:prolyl oligopeptidase family serine peptidase [Bacteroidales bacterium]
MKTPLITYLLFSLCLLSLLSPAQQPNTNLFEAHVHIEGNDTLPYRLYRSQKADTTNEALPLVIFLHGAGERGNDNHAQLTHCVRYFLDDTITNNYPFLLMVPQCPKGKRWVNTDWSLPEHRMEPEPTTELHGVLALTDSLINQGIVDATRVSICGISMGGFGVWDALQRQQQRFAAAIAICGGGDPAYAEAMKDIPIHIFHGMRDGVVMTSRSTQMY